MPDTLTVTTPNDTDVVMTRLFNAKPQLVFDAWTKPEHIRRWFGLRNSQMPVCEVDLRAGGKYRYELQESDGSQMVIKGEFIEIKAPGLLVYTEIFEAFEEIAGAGRVVMTLDDQDGKTLMTSTTTYRDREVRDLVVQSGMEEGAIETLDRLAELLAELTK